jgi:hypothetical protein
MKMVKAFEAVALLLLAACRPGIDIGTQPSLPELNLASLPMAVGVYYPATTLGFHFSHLYNGGVS